MKLPFEKIYCLHLSNEIKRYENFMSEFKRLGIEDQVEVWWTTKRKVSNMIGDKISSLHNEYYDNIRKKNYNVYGNVFNCSFEHYTMIKQAYERGIESILIMEDDIKFIDDVNLIKKYMDNIPKDYDIIKFHSGYYIKKFLNDDLYLKNYNKAIFSTLCYCLSSNGMKLIIKEYEEHFSPSDIILDEVCKKCNYYSINGLICHSSDNNSTITDK